MNGLPDWLARLEHGVEHVDPSSFGRVLPPRQGGRASAVLMLFAPDERGEHGVVLTQRAGGLRSHAGQVAFPGGRVDPHDAGPVDAALREADEEVGLQGGAVRVIGQLPDLFVPVSNSVVTTVLAWASSPPRLWARSTREVESVWLVPLTQLLDPAHRIVATHPNGYRGPAFELPQLYVWGFTAALLSRVFELAGLEEPWDRERTKPLPSRYGRPLTTDDVRDEDPREQRGASGRPVGSGGDATSTRGAAPPGTDAEAGTTLTAPPSHIPVRPREAGRSDMAGTS